MTAVTLVSICAVAGCCWLLLAAAIPVTRLRARKRASVASRPETTDGWVAPAPEVEADAPRRLDPAATRVVLERGLRSDERDARVAAVTALGSLAREHEWALDGLVEALASEIETPERIATELDRLAPRPGRRLAPLLGHPSETVRFYVVRLLGRYPELVRRHVVAHTSDPSPHVRAAALEALRAAGSTETLRRALELLSDPQPFVRAQACKTAAAIGGPGAAAFVSPLLADGSWWVREASREALVGLGPGIAPMVAPLVGADDPALRKGAALVLQDVGALDALVDGDAEELERVMEAGGGRLRRAAAERARQRRARGQPQGVELEQVS